MRVERERVHLGGRLPPWIRHEHLARYRFAAERAVGKIVIDCASGDGTCARILAEQGAGEVHGFDVSEKAVQSATRDSTFDNVHFAVARAEALPVPDEFADLYVSLETIEHLPDQEAFLRETARVLKPSGQLVCSTPDRDVYSPGNSPSGQPWNRFHIREYSQSEFTALLSRYYERVELFGQNPKSPRLVNLRVAVGRRTPWDLVVRVNQLLKLPRFLYDRFEHHPVVAVLAGRRYELLTAVCSGPRRASAG